MKLGFYYHIPVHRNQFGVWVPSYLGVFLSALSREVESLILVMHECDKKNLNSCDYLLPTKNILFRGLGRKPPAWYRSIFHFFILKKILKDIDVDFFFGKVANTIGTFFL